MSKFTRREFLKTSGMALAGLTIAPSSILGKSHGHISPSDKLNIAVVGIGGMGHTNINHVKNTENIVALCDVDWRYAKGVFDEFPQAKRYWDYRKMYDEMGKSIDAVIVATADHTHAIIRCHDAGQTRLCSEAVNPLCLRIALAHPFGCLYRRSYADG